MALSQEAPRGADAEPSLRAQVLLFAVTFLVLAAVAAGLTFHYRLYDGDALSRTYNAVAVLYDAHPRLANLGFAWAPLPGLLQVPLVLFRPLATAGFAGTLVTAFASALGLVLMDRILAWYVPSSLARWLLLLAYQTNVMILYYSINGMSEAILITLALLCWYEFQRLYEDLPLRKGVSHVTVMGAAAGLTFLTRFDGASFGSAMLVALLLVLKLGRRGQTHPGGAPTERPAPSESVRAVAGGYSIAYVAPFAYTIILWLFFNWQIMGNPFEFMFGKGSNVQWLSASMQSSDLLYGMKGNIVASAAYAAKVSGLLFPSFYLALALLALVALREADAMALCMGLVAASFPAFQAGMHFLGQSAGWARFYMYVIPFSIIALAYAVHRITGNYRAGARLWQATLVIVVAASSVFTFLGVTRSDIPKSNELAFARIIASNEIADNLAFERRVAEALTQLPQGKTILADELQADHIILFTLQFERFVTSRDPNFSGIAADPVGKTDYILVPRTDEALNEIVRQQPNIFTDPAPFLRLEQEFDGRPSNYEWRLYRVVDPKDTSS
ncbi:MAG: hypothetical protein M1370_09980 [Bacteroidetes bacterium]|nr:hypothetical protein [Bacteroidota bacterium]MCL5025010.1 hypothetical protein [Chloroflexota bacterium]